MLHLPLPLLLVDARWRRAPVTGIGLHVHPGAFPMNPRLAVDVAVAPRWQSSGRRTCAGIPILAVAAGMIGWLAQIRATRPAMVSRPTWCSDSLDVRAPCPRSRHSAGYGGGPRARNGGKKWLQ